MPPDDRYYYADGRRVPIVPSRHFVALHADDPEAFAESATAASISRMGGPGDVLTLPERELVVIHLPEGREEGAAVLEGGLAHAEGVTPGPVVFASPEGAEEVGMIPTGEIIVRFADGTDPQLRDALLAEQGLEILAQDYPEPGALLVRTADVDRTIDTANDLHEHGLVDYAEPNFLQLTPAPSDVLARSALDPQPGGADASQADATLDPGLASQWGLAKIRAPEAWGISSGNPSIAVAVLDEGCDVTHEDVSYRLPGYDAYDGDDDPQPNGNDAHGTACGGIVAMRQGNGRGGVGVAPRTQVLPVRIAKGVGGGFWDTSSAKVADAIRTAVLRGADVLSNSYSVSPSTAVTNAFHFAQTDGRGGRGCPIAAATGNADTLGVIYPARLSPTVPGFLAVGASNEWDQRKSKTSLDGESWWGSNWGPEVDVVAPGVHIYTTDIMGGAGYAGGNYVTGFNGTSSATPHAAGVMGLVLSVDPDLRSWEVEEIVKMTARDLGAPGRDDEHGFGRIDARAALEAASRLWFDIQVGPEFIGSGRECFMRASVRIYNPGINQVRLDALTVTSHSDDWSAEIDRIEYRPNPGGTMAPRSNDDVRLHHLLLKANGTESAWSYRWSLSWSYTFWRPAGPSLPLAPSGTGVGVSAEAGRGESTGGTAPQETPAPSRPATGGDVLDVDRGARTVTVILR